MSYLGLANDWVSGADSDAQESCGGGCRGLFGRWVLGFDLYKQVLQVWSRAFLVFSSSSAHCSLPLFFFAYPCVVTIRGGTFGMFCSSVMGLALQAVSVLPSLSEMRCEVRWMPGKVCRIPGCAAFGKCRV